jgi:hypothetical protein
MHWQLRGLAGWLARHSPLLHAVLRLLIWTICSCRCTAWLQKYIAPHQRDVTVILAALVQVGGAWQQQQQQQQQLRWQQLQL